MKPISDHLKENLKVLFVGFNPSIRSSELGHHYANPNNRFWRILYEAGLTSRKYDATEDAKLLDLGYGFTNIVQRPTKAADEITKEEYVEGREILKKKVEQLMPQVVCFVGKGVYQQYSGLKVIQWGKQPNGFVPGVVDFVAPSSSGLVRMKMEEIVDIYKGLVPILTQ
ncbi:mismatch-specific DNA-glycosylase [Priestia megaterium]|jgi:double-stranded uracil-DNA glycosylase|uniref:Mismatch-specific DNA-glycosylase n=1 Tax=Priestia megaterium TaxID=1404 RepID=A0A6H1P7L0_PRIMG|nr:mismatch-specific DNA-glycosylase [Priestia megaterium]QIZ09455.1 mismatch-specific DNA-glycosylase [Priestia megaterium]